MAATSATLSIVSHRQNGMVNLLLRDIARHCDGEVRVVLTENVRDSVSIAVDKLPFPLERIVNASPKGFGANHNAAFRRCSTPLFCAVNPDVRLASNPLPCLSRTLEDESIGVAGPLVRSSGGAVEQSARVFPTFGLLLRRVFRKRTGAFYPIDKGPVHVDWIAGMFMLFRSETFKAVGGFDEAYYLYYEDVDICRRLHARGLAVVYDPRAEITHDAQWGSRGNLSLALHHMRSVLRFLCRGKG